MKDEQIDVGFSACPADSAVWVLLDNEVVIYEEASGSVHSLNPTATLVWQCLDGKSPLRDIAADFAEVFEIDPSSAERQIVGLVREFGRQGLLAGVEPSN
jgi:PqqD family protein of HPr-rel-A system